VEIKDNTISDIQGSGIAGIDVRSLQGVPSATGVANVQATIDNNSVTINGADSVIQARANSGNTLCLDVTNNTAGGAATSPYAGFGSTHYIGNPVIIANGQGNVTYDGYITGDLGTTWNNNGNNPALTAGIAGEAWVDGTQPTNGTCTTVALLQPTEDKPKSAQSKDGVQNARVVETHAQPVTLSSDQITHNLFAAQRNRVEIWLAEFASQVKVDFISTFTVQPAFASGESINLPLGSLNPGQIVTITFDVTVDTTAAELQVCNQGLFTGVNFANTLTDDPDVGGSSDATCTDIGAPNAITLTDFRADNSQVTFIILGVLLLSICTFVLVKFTRRKK
jgi:hypothetical protein